MPSKLKVCAILAAAVTLDFAVSPAFAADTVNSSEIARIMRSEGFPVTESTDNYGDPVISSEYNSVKFSVLFYNCTGKTCDSMQLRVGYNLPNGMTLAAANSWNSSKRYAMLFLDEENDPWLNFDVLFAGAGNSTQVRAYLGKYKKLSQDFQTYINW